MLNLRSIDRHWTLFLDRDGVLNHDKPNSYIFNREEFKFYDGVLDALVAFDKIFGKIFIVTNQRGVGRGLMSGQDLQDIHEYMMQQIAKRGARIDRIYFCTANDPGHPNRKPNPGMALQAQQEFPAVDLSRSLIVGNNLSDMQFGRNAGMHTVFVRTTQPDMSLPHPDIDMIFDSLPDFAKALHNA